MANGNKKPGALNSIKKSAILAIGRYYKKKKQYRIANTFYTKALSGSEKSSSKLSINAEHAQTLFSVGKYAEALEKIDYVIESTDDLKAEYLRLRGEILLKLKRWPEAERNLQQSLNINNKDKVAYYLLGIIYVLQKKWYQAEETLLMAENLGYSSAKFYHRLGQACFHMEHYEKAIEAFKEAAEQWTQNSAKAKTTTADLYYLIGLCYEKLNDSTRSEEFYNEAIQRDEKYSSDLFGIGIFHDKNKEYDLAIQAYITHNTAESLFQLAMLYEKLEDIDNAEEYYKHVLTLNNVHAKYHFRLGNLYENKGNFEKAAFYYEQAIARNDHYDSQWYLKLLAVLYKHGDMTKYEHVLKEANIVADYVNTVYRNGKKKMSLQMRFKMFYEKMQVNKKLVLFESATGYRITSNPLAIFEQMIHDERFEDFTFVWSINDYELIPNKFKNLPNVIFTIRHSNLYYKYLSSAGFLFNDTAFPQFFVRKPEQKYLNTWHGTPWKTLGYDVKTARMDFTNAARNFLQASHLLVPNQYTFDHQVVPYQVSTIYPGELAVTGYPRIDLTFKTMHNAKPLKEELGITDDQKVVLYAPTWRGSIKFREFDKEQLEQDLEKLSRMNAHVLFRGHHVVEKLLQDIDIPNVTIVPNRIDTNELLGVTDILITDYSSIFFDFLVTDCPILHYVYDYEEYASERGFYFGLDKLPGDVVYSSNELIQTIETHLEETYTPTRNYLDAKNNYVYKDDGNVSKRVIDWVVLDENTVDVETKNTEKQKILFYPGAFQGNGITISFINLMKKLNQDKYEITIIVPESIVNFPERIELLDRIKDEVNIIPKNNPMLRSDKDIFAAGIMNQCIDNKKLFSIYQETYKTEFKRMFSDIKFDYLIDYSGYSPYFNQLFASKLYENSKNVVYAHSDMYDEYCQKHKHLALLFEQYKQYDKIISVSNNIDEKNKENLSEHFSIPTDLFDYVENIQDSESVIERSKESFEIEEDEMLFKDDKKVFINIGRLSIEKDQEKLIRAFSKVHKNDSNTRLIILGEGALRYKLLSVIDELGLEQAVFLLGNKPNPYPYLRKADCFVFSSNYEGQGLVLFEALILNKPIVATDIVASREILEDGYGELCENNVEGLVQGMTKFLNGAIESKPFEIEEYNEQAMDKFLTKVL